MTRPGVVVSSAAAPPPRGVPTDTGVAFICAEAQMGSTTAPTHLTSIDQFVAAYGQRLAAAPLGYDAVDTALHEGASSVFYMRLAEGGTAAKESAATITGVGSEAVAANPGTWGNGLVLTTTAATLFGVQAQAQATDAEPEEGSKAKATTKAAPAEEPPPRLAALDYPEQQAVGVVATVTLGGVVVQTSQPLTTDAALVAFLAAGPYMRITGATGTGEPSVGTVSLKGGTDGTVPVPQTAPGAKVLSEALARISPDYGPGQVLAPGRADAESHAALLAHAAGTATAGVNRVALLDGKEGDTETALKSQAAALRGSLQDRYGALWAPWAQIPGLAPGTTRSVPWSAVQAGMCARVDAAGNPNQAAAGPWGVARYVTGLVTAFTAAEREALLLAGVNTARSVYGTIESYAYRTLVDPNGTRSAWLQLNYARLNMAIVAKSVEVGEDVVFSQIDGRGHTIAAFNGKLAGMLKELYDEGALYGDEPAEAFQVNTGPAVNTPATLAEGVLKAVLSVRMSPHGELIQIEIVKVPITVALAA